MRAAVLASECSSYSTTSIATTSTVTTSIGALRVVHSTALRWHCSEDMQSYALRTWVYLLLLLWLLLAPEARVRLHAPQRRTHAPAVFVGAVVDGAGSVPAWTAWDRCMPAAMTPPPPTQTRGRASAPSRTPLCK